MSGAHCSSFHVYFQHPVTASYRAICHEHRYYICGLLFQHAIGRRNFVKLCASPAGMGTQFAAVRLKYHILSFSTLQIFVFN